ncbi:hypothetical protein ANAPC5_01238 [Anaplasma phagocytophilum]|nr:hypothetical protein ANAPC5_01238 [Anaplasma phagocytophilum]
MGFCFRRSQARTQGSQAPIELHIEALSDRGFAAANVAQDYPIVLLALPGVVAFSNTPFLHCDVARRPYRIADFKTGLQTSDVLQDLKTSGPYQINNFWAITFHT